MRKYLQKQVTLSFIVIMGFTTLMTYAQTGQLAGKVTDATSGEFLPGVNIILDGTNIGGATDFQGDFRIVKIPVGDYKMTVSYIGYDDFSTDIRIVAGLITKVNVQLTASYVELGDVVVEGLRQGQIKALSMQKESDNIKNVVSREQMENFPDVNVAEVLQRLPGVYIDRSQGDGRYVLIRGTDPRMSTVTVNGEALASTRNEERYSQLDIVGSNQTAFVEVIKAVTPDMDANSIGGAVNIITRSAFDYSGRELKIRAGGGYAELDNEPIYQGKINYSDFLGSEKKFGYTLTANYDRKARGTDNIEYEWDNVEDINGNEIPFALSELSLRDYTTVKERYGFGGGLEFRPNENHKLSVNAMWNKLDDDSKSSRMRLRVNKGNYLDPQGLLTEDSRIIRAMKNRIEELLQTHYSLAGEHNLGNNILDYRFGYSYGEEVHEPEIESAWEFDDKVNLALNINDPLYPQWRITNIDPELQYDAGKYEFQDVDFRNTFTSTKTMAGGLNFLIPYNFLNTTSNLKIGAKYTSVKKDRDDDRWTYEWDGQGNLTMDMFLSDLEDNDFMNDHYKYGPQVDSDRMADFIDQHDTDWDKELDYYDSEVQTYTVKENILAYYAMTTIKIGDFTIVGGFRHEFTSNDFTGTEVIFNDQGEFSSLRHITKERSYNNLFPMLHVNYNLGLFTKVRFAVTNTISRPNYWDLAPYNYIDYKRERIRRGNFELEPTKSTNIDLILEHYLEGVGLLSGSFFYKDLKNILFETTYDEDQGIWAGYEIEEPVNGGNAKLFGFELNWEQQLAFLPGFLSGFGIYANYTHTWADADLTDRSGFLPGQAGDAGNLSLSYETGPFKGRLSYAYRDKFIDEVGKNEDHDIYVHSHGQLDFTATYKLFKNFELFVDFVNLTNEPQREYMGDTSRPVLTEFYSWWSRFGVNYSLE